MDAFILFIIGRLLSGEGAGDVATTDLLEFEDKLTA